LTESIQNIQLEEGLVNYMMSDKQYTPPAPPREEIDQLVMTLTARKFQEKYSKSLNGSQQVLLEKYIRYQVTGDQKSFQDFLKKRRSDIMNVLGKASTSKEFQSDNNMKRKLDEAVGRFNSLPLSFSDDFISEMMLFENLVEEVESDG
jgi:hypothetical protein